MRIHERKFNDQMHFSRKRAPPDESIKKGNIDKRFVQGGGCG